MSVSSATRSEQELRELVDERARAVRAGDAETLAARPADDVITFDVLPPLNSRGSAAVHVGGTLKSGDVVDMWVRATLGCRRVDGRWRIVHDHESVPFDPATGQALISLAPA